MPPTKIAQDYMADVKLPGILARRWRCTRCKETAKHCNVHGCDGREEVNWRYVVKPE
jgi:hypothetical protein